MMTYEEFKEVVKETFVDYMPESYRNMCIDIRPVVKVNEILDGFSFLGEEQFIVPTMYINPMYEEYKKTEDLQRVLQQAAKEMESTIKYALSLEELDFKAAKNNIVLQLVNTEQNKEMLMKIPHREFQDLSIIYRWIVKIDEDGIQSSIISNSLAEDLGLTEEQMYKLALDNTRRILPPTIRSMKDVLYKFLEGDGMSAEEIDMMFDQDLPEKSMWVIGNDREVHGAASMLYEEYLHELSIQVGTDLYILPSSIHEVIAVSVRMDDPYELAKVVNTINMGQVALSERLSNQVYHYDKDLRKLTLATNTLNKRLDGMIAEPQPFYASKGLSR